MTGPDHFRRAEAIARSTEEVLLQAPEGATDEDLEAMYQAAGDAFKLAQVHATLALAAATAAVACAGRTLGLNDMEDWAEIAGTGPHGS